MLEMGRILIADDDDTFLRALAAVLEREGYACRCAPDAATAAEELHRAACDILIADIKMPGNTDLELIHELPQIAAGVPVILITGYPSLESAIAAIPLPVVAYLVKPPSFAQLFAAVDKALSAARVSQATRRLQQHVQEWQHDLAQLGHRLLPPAAIDSSRGQSASSHNTNVGLSLREHEVLRHLLVGERVATIARSLYLSPHTVRSHLKGIFRKLGVHSQSELLERFKSQDSAK